MLLDTWVTEPCVGRTPTGLMFHLNWWWTAGEADAHRLNTAKLGSIRTSYLSEQTTELYTYSAAAATKLLQSCPTLCDPTEGSPPGFPSLGFSRQEHWSGLPFPSPMHESEKSKWSGSREGYYVSTLKEVSCGSVLWILYLRNYFLSKFATHCF